MRLFVDTGLSLIANVQQHQYVTQVGTTAGLIVLIQPQHLMPFPEDRGKLVSPGYQTEIAFTQVLRAYTCVGFTMCRRFFIDRPIFL